MKSDYLNGTEYTLVQGEDMYHFNSDTELLGSFISLKHSDSVLDIGCSTGALLLYAGRFQPEKMTGVDLFEDVLEYTRRNLEANGMEADLSACRIQDYEGGPFDVVLCNPPYFPVNNRELVSEGRYIAAGRHEEYLPLEELFLHADRLLKDNGRFFLVHRVSRLNDIAQEAMKYGMRIVRMKIAYASKDGPAKSAAMEFRYSLRAQMKIEEPVFLDDRSTFGWGKEKI